MAGVALTPHERRVLELAAQHGPHRYFFSNQFHVAQGLVERRLLDRHPVNGGFEITAAGREAISG